MVTQTYYTPYQSILTPPQALPKTHPLSNITRNHRPLTQEDATNTLSLSYDPQDEIYHFIDSNINKHPDNDRYCFKAGALQQVVFARDDSRLYLMFMSQRYHLYVEMASAEDAKELLEELRTRKNFTFMREFLEHEAPRFAGIGVLGLGVDELTRSYRDFMDGMFETKWN